MAVVLTFDAPVALERCVGALSRQTSSVAGVLVVDNANDHRIDHLVAEDPTVTIEHLPENVGPAGGYAEGLSWFLRSRYELAWLMDDDCTPEPGALAALLAKTAPPDAQPTVVLPTVLDSVSGDAFQGHGWWGALIPRAVVEQVGVPNAELFWWTEDTEYLQWRIPGAGFEVRWADDAVVTLDRARVQNGKPAWKYYYETRNQVHHRLHVQKQPPTGPKHHSLRPHVRAWRAARAVVMLGSRALLLEHEQRLRKARMVARGAADGLHGRLGRTVIPDSSHRPSLAPSSPRPSGELVSANGSSVLALVLTFNAPDEVATCVTALQDQTLAPSEIVVIDNHGHTTPDPAVLAASGPVPVRVVRTDENLGPAGGHAAGMTEFLRSQSDYVWVMDDDVVPEPTCLASLLTDMRDRHDRALVGPAIFDSRTGDRFDGWGWHGALIPRAAVEAVGVPDASLIWGLEDQEYLRDRIPLAGYPPVRSETGVVRVVKRPDSSERPAWKYYYEARNRTFRYLYQRSHIPLPTRLKSLVYALAEQSATIWRSERDRVRKLGYVAKGVADGVLKRLGRRVSLDRTDRPWNPEP